MSIAKVATALLPNVFDEYTVLNHQLRDRIATVLLAWR
jgi:hypothetical protein